MEVVIATPMTPEDAERVAAAIGARAYKECSALRIEGVDDVFEAATRASMLMREGVPAGGRAERRRRGGELQPIKLKAEHEESRTDREQAGGEPSRDPLIGILAG